MKVLFLQDLRPTARAGDVKEVKNGFARNYLLPQRVAVLATKDELQRAEGLRHEAEERRLAEAKEWKDLADEIKNSEIQVLVRTGPTGRLYGSVTSTMIAAQLSEITEREIHRKGIRIPAPIRTVGKYEVPIRFVDGVESVLNLSVEADEESLLRAKQAKDAPTEVSAEDKALVDPTFEEVLAAVEAKIDEEVTGESSESAPESEAEEGEAVADEADQPAEARTEDKEPES